MVLSTLRGACGRRVRLFGVAYARAYPQMTSEGSMRCLSVLILASEATPPAHIVAHGDAVVLTVSDRLGAFAPSRSLQSCEFGPGLRS